ncbi:hypothetical protein [Noviherbaspirillum soli]|uniref:hypothetical protein n=1 Tax=Noviherbaspirillum soli TaxID=1064518 RepID=UPI00188C627A|nr:hypothetical protein [Noviherbaspirillum soli]
MDGNDDDNHAGSPRTSRMPGATIVSASSSSVLSETVSDTPVVSFNQIHRSHTQRQPRPENAGALSSHPRVDREILQLCQQYEANTDALAAMRLRPADDSASTNELARLQKERKELATRLQQCASLLQPDLSGTLMERVKSAATIDLANRFRHVWNDYQQTQRDSCTKYLWNMASGAVAYAIPFGTATMLSRGLKIPYLVLLAGTLHTLAEPIWTMVRTTSWTNPASETYVGRQRARARANGDAWRYLAHIPPKAKMLWQDPRTGQYSRLTAAQALATNQELWLWLHKVVTDDLPFFVFFFLYASKNSLNEVLGPAFFDRASPLGMRNDLLAQFGAGLASGALTTLLAQGLRRAISGATQGQEVVTKSLHVWELEARYLKSYIQDIEEELSKTNLPVDDTRQLRRQLVEVRAQHAKAHAKSSLPTSIGHEFGVMFQKKRESTGTDPDMPGKRLDTVCSILGKTTSLLPGLLATHLCQPLASSDSLMERMIAHTVPPFFLIAWPGFAMRTEFQDMWRSLYGASKGMLSAMRAGCCCAADPDDGDEAVDASTDGSDSEDEYADAGQNRSGKGSDQADAGKGRKDGSALRQRARADHEASTSSDKIGTRSGTSSSSGSNSSTSSSPATSGDSNDGETSSSSKQESRDASTESGSYASSDDNSA